jgi:hypothetical protein
LPMPRNIIRYKLSLCRRFSSRSSVRSKFRHHRPRE